MSMLGIADLDRGIRRLRALGLDLPVASRPTMRVRLQCGTRTVRLPAN